MKQTAKRILAFVSVVCIAFLGIVTMPFVQVNAAADDWNLVTDASTLAVGDQVIIAAKDSNYALSTTQNNNNRAQAAITKSGDTATFGDDVQVLTLEAGTVSGTFAFYTGSGYLYAASNSSNYLRTQPTNNANGSWKIEIAAATGVATVKAQGSYTRNILQYNQSSSLFACYSSASQKAVCLYKLEVDESVPTITISTESNLAQVQVGDVVSFEAETANVDESSAIIWTSSNTDVATIVDGKLTAKAMGTTTVTATIDGTEVSNSKEVTVYPSNAGVITIAEAIEICDFVGANGTPIQYSVTGTIDNIDTEYSEQYGNITVTISDETGSIQAYRMKDEEGASICASLLVGSKITVKGSLKLYDSTYEFDAGCICVEEILSDEDEKIKEDLGKVNAWMSMGYKYVQSSELVDVSSGVVDTLNRASTGVTGTSYTSWSGKTASSDAVYAGESAGGNESIQLRTTNSREGVVTTASGGKATKVEIAWNSNTNSKRILQVYGSNTAYSSAADLFATDKQGTLLGELAFASNQTIVEIDEDYEFIGIRSKDSALYLDSVSITWESGTTGGQEEKVVLSDSQFRLKFGVDESLFAIENVSDFGITITAGEKTKTYNSTATLNWKYDEENNRKYVVIDLGDIVNDKTKLTTEFTVQTYVVVGERTFEGNKKTYSVASMIEAYYADENTKAQVEVLYNYLKDKGAI